MNISDRNIIHCDVAWVTNRISISNGLTNAEARCHIRRFLDRKPWGGISGADNFRILDGSEASKARRTRECGRICNIT